MDELLEQFLIEAPELVQQASDDLLALESDPANKGRIDSAFRAVHTLKGSVGLFDLAPMGTALHAGEELLGVVRAGRLPASAEVISALLTCVSACDVWVTSIARTGGLPQGADAKARDLAAALLDFLPSREGADQQSGTHPRWLAPLLAREETALKAARDANQVVTAVRYVPEPDCFFRAEDPIDLVKAIPHLISLHIDGRRPWSTEDIDPYECNLAIQLLSTAPAEQIRYMFAAVGNQATVVPTTHTVGHPSAAPAVMSDAGSDLGSRMLRVDAGRLDALADILGELIVAKNGLSHLVAQANTTVDTGFARALSANQASIERLIGNMHRELMSLRLVPLGRTLRRFPRLVRDLADKLGKQVSVELKGDDVEADKAVVDGLFEPMLHALRNAVDHGIEGAEARHRAGKPLNGRIGVQAKRAGEHIVIEISDDGPGVDAAKVRAAARAAGLRTDGMLHAMDDAAALDLIFAPGLSTAAHVNDISGRGVGMDAVRAAIEAIGGRVGISSIAGRGTTVRFTLPQAIIITTVMVATVGQERYGIPMEAIVETVRFPASRITPIRTGAAFVLRDRTIPLVRLGDLLDMPSCRNGDVKVLIADVGNQRVGIEVDNLAERIDVLLRPMTGLLASMPGILGTALLGDGNVLMVLDMPELIG